MKYLNDASFNLINKKDFELLYIDLQTSDNLVKIFNPM